MKGRHLNPGIRAGFTPLTIQEAVHDVPPSALVSIRTQSVIPASWAGRISGILTRSTGWDHVKRFRRETGCAAPAGYLPLYCASAVAEQALLLWLGLLRKLPAQVRQLADFDRDGLIHRLGTALGMAVKGVDIVERHPEVEYVDIGTGLAQADVIACAMSLGDGNRGYFDYDRLKEAKPGALFVNIARGELSPLEDLLRLLDEGRLSGVALDVYEDEGRLAVSLRRGAAGENEKARVLLELSRRGNVILTPHNAFNTREALERKAAQSAAQAQSFLGRGEFIWEVPAE